MKSFYKSVIVLTLSLIVQIGFAQTTTSAFKVEGACGMCKQRIEKVAKQAGATSALWDMETHILTVKLPANISQETIETKLAEAGHDTENKKATDEVYEALPECCFYRTASGSAIDQQSINGVVLNEDNKGNFKPLHGATIVWINSGKGTMSDENGFFTILPEDPNDRLLISYAGYTSDTLEISNMNDIQIILGSNNTLQAVQVTAKTRSTFINKFDPIRVQTITSKELMKAACCNLSESFETNPSVDVSYNDAVSGSKQIQLLGLAGVYAQLTVENMPGPRGLATASGLTYIPGPWIESIQLSKGTGSVVNGYESIAGQINIELKKPQHSESLFANAYANDQGKVDINLNLATKVGEHWSTGLLLHNAFLKKKMDINNDGFRDQPTGNLFTLMNRWYFEDHSGKEVQFGIKVLTDRKTGGEMDFTADDKLSPDKYGVVINNDRYEFFGKLGYVFPNKKYQSIGFQFSAFDHEQEAYFGNTVYKARQTNLYANLIYQNILWNSKHVFKTGLSLLSDKYDETFKLQDYSRNETATGGFFEYAFTPNKKLGLVAGVRADHNTLYGWFVTPRLNVRFEPVHGTTIRVSGGRGQRTANIFAENMSVLASARNVNILNPAEGKAYGLDAEVSWNKGISIDQQFKLFRRSANIAVDFFRNDFENQVVVDLENAREINFYNLDGKSYSNSLQVEFNMIPVKHLETKFAYRWFDVKTTYGNELLQKPLTSTHRAFANIGYEVKGWRFDYTINYNGSKRIPSTKLNPVDLQFEEKSPDFFTMNAQITKVINKKHGFEVYVGGENLSNYTQHNAIISNDQPFSPYFDASLIWGPLQERMIYAGFRIKVK